MVSGQNGQPSREYGMTGAVLICRSTRTGLIRHLMPVRDSLRYWRIPRFVRISWMVNMALHTPIGSTTL